MREINTWRTVRTTYIYDDELELEMHKKIMNGRGYHVLSKSFEPLYVNNDLVVTYEIKDLVDDIARF